jgi:glucose-6-phosphate 1-dehydrogenase
MNKDTTDQNTVLEAFATARAPDLGIDYEECLAPERSDPCTIVIMGATGDLTARKLIPALYNLYLNNGLPDPFVIVGCGRTQLDTGGFRDKMEDALRRAGRLDTSTWTKFSKAIHYQAIEYEHLESYQNLAKTLKDLDSQLNTRGNRIFYIALPPVLYQSVARLLGQAELSTEKTNANGWSRIVIEKPFGINLDTARELDRSLHEYFNEHQIFRIDHYLAKETVQNILMFRFSNSLF